jgi:5,10-methylenetetrahydromethanopterin reductase
MALTGDRSGATSLWIASHLFHREPIACAMATLAQTRDLRVVLMAISPYTVHPVYATMAAATLDEYFPGRVQLCFGVGAPRDLEAAGVQAAQPVRTLRETFQICRALLQGETVNHDGERFKVSGRRLLMGAHSVPLWLAASGPQMLELAGEVADGVVISAGTSPAFIRWCLDHVRNGETKAGRSVAKAALVFCSVHESAEVARARLRGPLAYLLRGQHHARNLELAGTKLDQLEVARAFAAEDWDRVEALITDSVLRAHTVSGTVQEAREAIAAYHSAGLDEIVVYGKHDQRELESILSIAKQPPGQ